MRPLLFALGLTALVPVQAHALQDTGDPAALADSRESARRAAGPARELARLEDALARGDADADRHSRAAQLALTLALIAEDAGNEEERLAWLRRGEAHARVALTLHPESNEARYMMGAALGLRAPHEPVRERLKLAGEIRDLAQAALEDDPGHAGALHLVGQLNAAAMRLGSVTRFLARTLLGGAVVADASWEDAEAAFRAALEREPNNHAHRIELAHLLKDTGRIEEARAEVRTILEAPDDGPLREHYRARALRLLTELN